MFSVLLSVYYKEKPEFLQQSLDSILSQTLLPNEIILVKDGPLTKELDSLIEIYQQKYSILKIVSLPQNRGLGNALNEGLKHCNYELVARIDTDDIAKSNRFQRQLAVFQEHPEIDICSSWIEEFEDTPEHILAIKKVPETHEEIVKYAKHRSPINHPAVIYKKSSVLGVNGYNGFPEDYCLWIKMIQNGANFYNVQESLLWFRFSRDVIRRRGGLKYAISDIHSQMGFYRMHFIGPMTLLYNIIVRVGVRLIPNQLRTLVYKLVLRK